MCEVSETEVVQKLHLMDIGLLYPKDNKFLGQFIRTKFSFHLSSSNKDIRYKQNYYIIASNSNIFIIHIQTEITNHDPYCIVICSNLMLNMN